MTSPAERYAAYRRRAQTERTALAAFSRELDFDLDAFQVEACEALEAGRGVLVAAPTGAGKTVVGEFAVRLGLDEGRKSFYTTPIKALSNQKYLDLVRVHGAENVGLLTGDVTINGEAPVVVMTTEVLRNMIYAGSPTLDGLRYVVMDEVHYLADRFRGSVWEEVIILLAADVRLVSLSATVSNAEEFGQWLETVRGDTAVVVSEHRPVPLWQHMMVRNDVLDLYSSKVDPTDPGAHPPINPDILEAVRRAERTGSGSGAPHRARRGRGGRSTRDARRTGHQQVRPARRPVVVDRLDREGLLPAIVFVFSRAGCEDAVAAVVGSGITLTTEEEQRRIREIVEVRCAALPAEDLDVLGFWQFARALERGVAAHHAGLLPVFKETVEALFSAGLVKVVFATETLALGINMPARSVVLERLVKWDGREHVAVSAGEYTQLTGRAGRRGIDVEGHAVVLYASGTDPVAVAGLASRRTYPLRSSFRPTYNMAVNLVLRSGRAMAREVLETSFAQFQADRAVVGLARQARAHAEALEGYREAMACDRGDIESYLELRREIGDREADLSRERSGARRRAVVESLTGLRPGDVVEIPRGRRSGYAVVLDDGGTPGLDGPTPLVLMQDRQVRRISADEAPAGVRRSGRVRIPRSFNARDARARRDLASSLRNALAEGKAGDPGGSARARSGAGDDAELARLRARLKAHPCHGCPEREDHVRWAHRTRGLAAEHDGLVRRIESRTSSIARDFDRVCEILLTLGYLDLDDDGETVVTTDGRWMRRLYAERDLVLAESLRAGAWSELDAPGLAALCSTIVYTSRSEETESAPRLPGGPGGAVARAVEATVRIAGEIEELERERRLTPTPPVDPGLVRAVHQWANGAPLATVLESGDLAAGDFVRWCRQVVDLLDQVGGAAPDPSMRARAREATDRVLRGIVAQSAV
ncbi:DEAD/DEAH box helicase domain protein [Beutenbergia cavernae DSM 12333]|uniref:DEAD/DEAH box helicase domain protein n=1 Tax=Beutenbergia cavernae (strain ATCC BAA-8 / DSM 12333 / CCUG 43141 / JCM 11478 / NBRC 16432 / NCIMB 13614 / HKI 0122) TaxID=471853 RepID=C5C6B2_BEUC1|nr:DEAD/DEAH box helicase [Beutenbergia cavernae]ACQ80318.1 DEAD/DEAH box helicase domain protein [Beutenbergia cavernae DSM 12333]